MRHCDSRANATLADIDDLNLQANTMIEIEERKIPNEAANLLLIGPGAVGKSSLGAELAPLLKRRLADLDQEFLRRVGDIGSFIRENGYEAYKTRNSLLATEIASENMNRTLLVTSSGFLTPDNPPAALDANRKLLNSAYAICLLPSRDPDASISVVVERQLARRFSRDPAQEKATIQDRYPIYLAMGDLVVFSTEPSIDIARAVARHLCPSL